MAEAPVYSPFFGAMGATAAMVFSGEWKTRDVEPAPEVLAVTGGSRGEVGTMASVPWDSGPKYLPKEGFKMQGGLYG